MVAVKKKKATKKKVATRTVKRLWASVNHSPYQVQEFLDDLSNKCFDGALITQTITPQNLDEDTIDPDAHIYSVVSASAFEAMLDKMDLSEKTVIIIENVVLATQYKEIVLLDCTQVKSYLFKFKPLDASTILNLREVESDPIDIDSTKVDIIPALLNAQPPSLLNPVMTMAYTLPDVDKRTQILVDIFDMVASNGKIEDRPWYRPTNKQMVKLKEWLDSNIGKKATKALSNALNKVKVTDSDEEFHALGEKYNVSKFDINYTVKFIKKIRISHPHIDTKEMFSTSEHNQQEQEEIE